MSSNTETTNTQGNAGLLPNECKVKGTIISIDSSQSFANVKIYEVMGAGSAFTANLNPGNEIWVDFTFTLLPSENKYPSLHLPGLKEGDSFIANIEATIKLGGGFNFYIGDYQKLK